MVVGDKLVFADKKGNRLYVTKDGMWYGYDKKNAVINLNSLIILVESAGFIIERIEKISGKIRLVLEDEAVEKDLM